MKKGKRLTAEERHQIAMLHAAEIDEKRIARLLNRDPRTIKRYLLSDDIEKIRLTPQALMTVWGAVDAAEDPDYSPLMRPDSKENESEAARSPIQPRNESEPMESIPKSEKSIVGANKAIRDKIVFSFRAETAEISRWKAYATAAGCTMESLGRAAMKEYLDNHALSGEARIIFDALCRRDHES